MYPHFTRYPPLCSAFVCEVEKLSNALVQTVVQTQALKQKSEVKSARTLMNFKTVFYALLITFFHVPIKKGTIKIFQVFTYL